MIYCKVIDGLVVEGPSRLPNNVPESLATEQGWYPTVFLNMPHHIEPDCNPVTQVIRMNSVFTGLQVECTYFIADKSTDDIQATEVLLMGIVREERNNKLLKSDWTQLPNAPLTDGQKTAWENYRNALRNFPATVNLSNVVWPTPP